MRKFLKTILGLFLAPQPQRPHAARKLPRQAGNAGPALRNCGGWQLVLCVIPYAAPIPLAAPGQCGKQIWPAPPVVFGYGQLSRAGRPESVELLFQYEERRFTPFYFTLPN